MSRRVVTTIIFLDDLTGEEFTEGEGESLAFTWEGRAYELDLTKANAERFREAMAPWLAVSRRASGEAASSRPARPGTGKPGVPRRKRSEIRAIREWGRAQGFEVPDLGEGRTPEAVLRAYDEAHPRTT